MRRSLVILSSSPVRHADLNATPPVADFPSNSLSPADISSLESLRQRQRPKGGSRAAQPPQNAVLGFQSASAVYQSQLELAELVQPEKEEVVKKLKRRASTRKKAQADEGSLPLAAKDTVKAGMSRALGTEGNSGSALEPKVKVSKPRAKRVLKDKTPNEQGGTEKKRGRPKKDAAEGNKEPVPTTKKVTGKASSHFIAPEKENGTTGTGAIDLTLEDEVILPTKRKLNWTPPKNTAPIQAVEHESLSLSTDSPVLKNMTGLLMDFGYIGENSLTSQSGLTGDPALLKRKRIELIGTGGGSLVDLPPMETGMPQSKEPSPKKKLKTITAFATERFLPVEENSASNEPAAGVFAARARVKGKNAIGSRQKAEKSSSKPAKGRKKSESVKPKLLSPMSAARRLARQDVLFGTSSQLAHEESPASLRELQQALKESELVSLAQAVKNKTLAQFRSARIASASSGGLWSAAAICSQDNPFNIEQQADQSAKKAHPLSFMTAEMTEPSAPQIIEGAQLVLEEDVWKDIDDLSYDVSVVSLPDIKNGDQIITTQATNSEVTVVNHLLSSKTLLGESPAKVASQFATATEHPTFDFVKPDTFTQTSEPPKKISSTAPLQVFVSTSTDDSTLAPLKNPRGHPRKNPLLVSSQLKVGTTKPAINNNEGWTSIDDIHESEPGLLMVPEVGSLVPVKKPRGRPRKNPLRAVADDASTTLPSKSKAKAEGRVKGRLKAGSVATEADSNQGWTSIDDIQDSEPELTPSPPRRQRKKGTPAQVPELPLSSQETVAKSTAAAASRKGALPHWDTLKETVCSLITAAVKRAPRSSDPLNPNWYEKMLLYDPIVVEDFTAWLNDEGLRVRGDDEDRLLQPWMTQKWCEENSVCCIWKISAWNGARGSRSVVD